MLSYRAAEFLACVVLIALDIAVAPTGAPVVETAAFDSLAHQHSWMQAVWGSPPLQAAFAAGLAAALYVPWRLLVGGDWAAGRGAADHRLWCLAAVALCVGGQAFRQWSKVVLGRFFTYQLTEPTELVTAGPYAVLLHPGYTGVIASHVGLHMLMWPTSRWRAAVVPALVAGGVAAMLRRMAEEEAMLAGVFGGAFRDYAFAGRTLQVV
jgi:protein-S-isoprenylcysteine O-methyltransferase Ste14